MYTCTIYIYIYTHTHTHTHVHTYACTYAYVYIYTHIFIHKTFSMPVMTPSDFRCSHSSKLKRLCSCAFVRPCVRAREKARIRVHKCVCFKWAHTHGGLQEEPYAACGVQDMRSAQTFAPFSLRVKNSPQAASSGFARARVRACRRPRRCEAQGGRKWFQSRSLVAVLARPAATVMQTPHGS